MPLLSRYLAPDLIRTLRSHAKDGAIRELAAVLAASIGSVDVDVVNRAVLQREKMVSSWIAPGIAIPHARLPDWDGIALAVGRSRKGVSWDSSDGNPVNLIFLIVSGENDPDQHVMLLAEIARTLRDRALTQLILTARTPEDLPASHLARARGRGRQARFLRQAAAFPPAFCPRPVRC